MKLFSWLFVLFSLVLLSIELEGVHASSFLLNLTSNRIYKNYYMLFSRYFGKEYMKFLPAPLTLPLVEAAPVVADNVKAQDKDVDDDLVKDLDKLSIVAILEDNRDLNLGDVLIDRKGEIFFFLSSTKKDAIISTLMRASTGLCGANYEINVFTLLKRFEKEDVYYLDYANDADVRDRFKVLQDYGEYTLLRSTCYSIVFVTPSDEIDEFVRGEFQKRVLIHAGQNSCESPVVPNPNADVSLTRSCKSDSFDDFLISPDSVTHPGLHQNLSHIEIIFGEYGNSSTLRLKFINDILVPMLSEDKVTVMDALVLIRRAAEIFRREGIIEFIKVEYGENITVVGDIHGQFIDLLRIFKNRGWPSESKKYLFNGDIVDRGRHSLQCLLLLYALKITFPRSLFINRGNHESEMCGIGTFFRDTHKFDPSGELFKSAQLGFISLPIAHVINNRIYVVHGGIRGEYSIEKISKLNRFSLNESTRDFIIASLWDDASELDGITANIERGPSSRKFGPDVTQEFLERNELDLLIRSHTQVNGGIELSQGGRCLTLFSAPNYCGMGNIAAVVTYDFNLQPEFTYFKAAKTV